MQKHHRIASLVLVPLLVLTVGGGVAAWRWIAAPLPEPEEADCEQLICWLVTRDLARYPQPTRLALALRLEEEFHGKVDWDATGRRLSPQQRRQLWSNVPWLLEPWLLDKAEGYFGIPGRERTAYVDRVLDTIASWQGVEALRPEDGDTERPAALMTMVSQRVDAVQECCDAQQRGRIDRFLLAVRTRWLLRTLWGAESGDG